MPTDGLFLCCIFNKFETQNFNKNDHQFNEVSDFVYIKKFFTLRSLNNSSFIIFVLKMYCYFMLCKEKSFLERKVKTSLQSIAYKKSGEKLCEKLVRIEVFYKQKNESHIL